MEVSTVFKNNQTQAVRLPKAVALPDDVKRVSIVAIGRSRIISPLQETWDSWFDGPSVPDGYMVDREQAVQQEREEL